MWKACQKRVSGQRHHSPSIHTPTPGVGASGPVQASVVMQGGGATPSAQKVPASGPRTTSVNAANGRRRRWLRRYSFAAVAALVRTIGPPAERELGVERALHAVERAGREEMLLPNVAGEPAVALVRVPSSRRRRARRRSPASP